MHVVIGRAENRLHMTGLKPASLVEEGEQVVRLSRQRQAKNLPPLELSDAARCSAQSCSA